jgi:hypothetical protein
MEMKLFLFHIIGTFFFDAVPTDLDSFEETENVTRKVRSAGRLPAKLGLKSLDVVHSPTSALSRSRRGRIPSSDRSG